MFEFLGNRKPDEKAVKSALEGLTPDNAVTVLVDGRTVSVVVNVSGSGPHDGLRAEIEKRVAAIKNVHRVSVILTSERPAGTAPAAPKVQAPKPSSDYQVPQVVAVASGKGGVGKSTVAVNLAAALQASGKRVGLLDVDIYGPSLPRLTGLRDAKPERAGEKIIPIDGHGMKLMSMGFLVNEEAPMIWRGPMVHSAVRQLLHDVDWSGCDVLVLDLPPGTGDVQLTLVQQVPLSGAVIVSTPQDIALVDARKGLEMFRKTNVPVFGIVENMSYFCCPACGARSDIFGHGGARAEAEKLGVPFLGEIPLDGEIRALSDAGKPVVLERPDSAQAKAFAAVAQEVEEMLREHDADAA